MLRISVSSLNFPRVGGFFVLIFVLLEENFFDKKKIF